jgi:hypothetical protein
MRYALLLLAACGPPPFYASCDEAAQCAVPDGVDAECVGDTEGFCTWSCDDDEDCTEPAGEPGLVCASFESSEGKHCFPGCEGGEECPRGSECASTGGGDENRKVCKPL